jgi:hypothetical protein
MFNMDEHSPNNFPLDSQIKVIGSLHERWSDWFGGFRIEPGKMPDGSEFTVLQGSIEDQAALRGILDKLLDLNLVLISVQQVQPPFDRNNNQQVNRTGKTR